jgi:hypothetical protein
MNTARRWYIYLVCAVSLQAVAWAVIALLRNLLAGGHGEITAIAFQIATIIIALPLFLAHWLWAQRLADRDINEREASLRGTYHYAMMAGFLGPVIANAFSLIAYVLWVATGRPGVDVAYSSGTSTSEDIFYNLIVIIMCTLLWFYQKWVVAEDVKASPESEGFATMRRLYLFVFSAWGMTMTTMAVIHILRWIMFQFGNSVTTYGTFGGGIGYLTDEATRLIVGVPLWLIFWRQAQSLFIGPNESEHESALRKFYLYTTVVVAVLAAVTNATEILAGLFRRILSLAPEGDIRTPLPIIIGMGLLWLFHAFILKDDAAHSAESVKQGGVRRLYLYLVAWVGLAAFLTGLSGDLSVLIRSFSQGFGSAQKEALAWFTAALIAGLPVWLIPWRQVQNEAEALTPEGIEARRTSARKAYLYSYLFIATMTVLSSGVYILYRLLSLMLGARGEGNLASGIAQAIAYAIVSVGVWLYHGSALRGDVNSSRNELALRLKDVRVAIVDVGEAGFGQALLSKLQQEQPSLNFDLVSLPTKDAESRQAIVAQLGGAGVIVGPWAVAVDGGVVDSDIVRAVVKSVARKILIPMRVGGWDWAGVDHWNIEALVQQTVHAVRQWAGGEEIKAVRPAAAGSVVGMVIGIVILLILVGLFVMLSFGM